MKRRLWLVTGTVAVVLVVSGFIIAAERQNIFDWWRLHNYHPSATVQQLADETTMTPYARHLFYVYHPQLESSTQFNGHCHPTDQAIVLGCTVVGQGIYLYDVTDSRLKGIEQVTAAYEMLHIGYSRLSTSRRKYIDQLVMQAYKTASAHDPRLKAEEQSYLKTEGAGAVPNELHSMMGTEVADLSPALENYYKQYFVNRQAIIKLKNQYQAVFTEHQQAVANDDVALTAQKRQITADEASLQTQLQTITNDQNRLDMLKSNHDYEIYNARVPAFNAKVDSYNSSVATVKGLISKYNQLVQKRNAIALEEDQLVHAISSAPTQISQ